jgi:2-polyprenyl-6-methoxyphenol hydroxylase-like FAD-dependent oxidoreductase
VALTEVLVVGAGPTGLTAAACLARSGVAVRIIDRATVPPDDRSRAAVVQARTLEIFDNLGIAEEALEAGLGVQSVNVFHPNGRRGTLSFSRPGMLDTPYDEVLALPQDQTERILGELVARLGVRVERGVALTALRNDASSATVELTNAHGLVERAEFAWIIGADGAHSAARQLAGLSSDGVTYRDEGLIGDVDIDWKLPPKEVSLCPNVEGFMLGFPLPGERHFRVIMIVPRDTPGEDRHLELDEFRAQLERMTPRGMGADGGPPRIETVHWLTRYRLHRRGVPCYRGGRVLVAGDAAHIHSPVGAQGMNTGIQDSYNLCWKLPLVMRGEAPAWLVDTYDEERRRIGEILLNGTDKAFGAVAGHGWFARTMRRIAPTFATRLVNAPFIGHKLARFVSQLGIRYRQSRLSTEAPGATRLGHRAPRAGDRAPDVPLRTPAGAAHRLFDELRGPHHTLVLFRGNDSEPAWMKPIVEQVGEHYRGLIKITPIVSSPDGSLSGAVFDPDKSAHAHYGAERGAIYLIRPDGHIGFRGGPSDFAALSDDLRRRFIQRPADSRPGA